MRWMILILLLAAAGLARAQEPLVLTPENMLAVAEQALANGQPDVALRFANALLARNGQDKGALLLRAQARRALGDISGAKVDARALWQAADDDAERFAAAMVIAQALSTKGQRTMAQWWLRRAAQNAPSDAAYAKARRDFAYVRSRNPVTLQFSLSATPSTNVNGGSAQDRFNFYGFEVELSGDAKALSGLEASLGINGAYRFGRSETGNWEATFGAESRTVWLTSAAQEQAPTARGSNFAFASLQLGLGHKGKTSGDAPISYAFGATAAHNWYGGVNLSDTLRLEASAERPLSDKMALSFGAGAERQWRKDSASRSADVLTLRFGGVRLLANEDRLNLMLTGSRTIASNVETASEGLSLRLGWDKATPIWNGITVNAGLTLGMRDFAQSRYAAGGRHDKTAGVDVSLVFTDIEYLGFTPSLDLRASRTDSNVGLFESEDMGISLGIRSAF
jgi:Surface lipoprotein assembly modifier